MEESRFKQQDQEKLESERRHQMEVKTLSGNLGTVRMELETMRRRCKDMENNNALQRKKAEGMLHGNSTSIFQLFIIPESASELRSMQEQNRTLLDKLVC